MNRYSVPMRLIGHQVRVLLHASDLVVYDGRTEVARHERLAGRGGSRLELDHYLEGLLRKPGALPGATVLEQARAAGRFTPVHDAWWAAARTAHGDTAGTRALVEVLLLHRRMAHEHVVAGIAAALRAGAMTADVVAMEARKAADADTPGAAPQHDEIPQPSPVTSLTGRRLATLPADTRPLPSVAAYDQLLRHPRPPAARPAIQGDSAMTIQRHRGLTEHAADAAIDTACRVLRLPTLRAQFTDLADTAAREQMTYRGFLAETADGRMRRPGPPPLRTPDQGRLLPPARSHCATFDFEANPNIDPARHSTPSPPATGSAKDSRSA